MLIVAAGRNDPAAASRIILANPPVVTFSRDGRTGPGYDTIIKTALTADGVVYFAESNNDGRRDHPG